MKRFFELFCFIFLSVSCETDKVQTAQPYRDDGLPMWIGESFSNPRGYWGGYIEEKGYFASEKAKHKDMNLALNAARLDAKKNLLNFISKEFHSSKISAILVGVQYIDRFATGDGTVYVLIFISKKDARKCLAEN